MGSPKRRLVLLQAFVIVVVKNIPLDDAFDNPGDLLETGNSRREIKRQPGVAMAPAKA